MPKSTPGVNTLPKQPHLTLNQISVRIPSPVDAQITFPFGFNDFPSRIIKSIFGSGRTASSTRVVNPTFMVVSLSLEAERLSAILLRAKSTQNGKTKPRVALPMS